MQALVNGPDGARSWRVRQAAIEAVRGVERGMHEIDSVFNYVKDNIEFRGENGETLQAPRVTLELGAGDCDDQSMLASAMLKWLGYATRFRTISLSSSPEEFSHVYAEVRDKQTGQWIPLDTTVERAYPGWQPEQVARSQAYGTIAPRNSGIGLGGLLSVLAWLL
jgi:transglutaminase-like putative cysteine protease